MINYEEEAERIIDRRFGQYNLGDIADQDFKLLKIEFANALRKAGGEPEYEFKFGDRVLVGEFDSEDPSIEAIFWKMNHNLFKVILPSGDYGSFHYCIPDPTYASTLTFIEHDRSDKCPYDLNLKAFRIYESGLLGAGAAQSSGWSIVKKYAIVPEDF